MKIKSIKKIDYTEDVYNLRIKDNHNYFANNYCVSNCHDYDDVVSDFITIRFTESIIKRLTFSNESEIIKKLKKVKSISQYIEFLKDLEGEIGTTISEIERSLGSQKRTPKSDKRDNKLSKILGGKNADSKLMQVITDLKQYQSKIEIFLKEYNLDSNNWVLENRLNEKTKQIELSLEPIWAYDYLDK